MLRLYELVGDLTSLAHRANTAQKWAFLLKEGGAVETPSMGISPWASLLPRDP
jgi:hypothetical protein